MPRRKREHHDRRLFETPRGHRELYFLDACELAEQEHRKSKRQYAHVMHRKRIVCLAGAFWRLPLTFQLGLLLHEMAHLVAPDIEDEAAVDRFAAREFGVKIHRVDCRYGKRLECIDEDDIDAAVAYLDLADLVTG